MFETVLFRGIARALAAVIIVMTGALALSAEPVNTDLTRQRSLVSMGNTARLQAVMDKARRGESITLAAIGGSITAGGQQTKDPANRYISRISGWFTKTFPKAKVRFVNAGIGGTNSFYGAMRVSRDVLSQKPDLVVVEYCVNDREGKDFAESYEGVLRQILREPQSIAVIELFFMHNKGENAQMWQEMLGRHYQLPMVSFRDAWWPELNSGRALWDDLYADVVHPKDAGHILASELLINLLEEVNKHNSTPPVPVQKELPPPMISDVYADCVFVQYTDLKPSKNNGFTATPDNKFWEGMAAGNSIEFEFSGRTLFLGFDVDKSLESALNYTIDDGKSQPLKFNANRLPIVSDLKPGKHRVRVEIAAGAPAGKTDKVRIWGVGGAGNR